MPKTIDELLGLLDLETIEEGLYRGSQLPTALQQTFGGQVLAQALVAAHRTVEPDRMVHSLHGYFLRPGVLNQPLIYQADNLRDGRGFSSRHTVARQDGVPRFAMNASFHIDEDGLDHADPMPPKVPRPDQCPRMSEIFAARLGPDSPLVHEWDALDVRFAGDSAQSAMIAPGAHQAHMRVWVRTVDRLPHDQVIHRAMLAYISDLTLLAVSTLPHPEVVFLSPGMQTASIDHAMWFHRVARADEWLLYDQVSPSASGALGFSTGRLFQDGRLVASCSQEGLIRVIK